MRLYRKLLIFLLTTILIVGIAVPAVLAREQWSVYVDAGRDVSVILILNRDPSDDRDAPDARAVRASGNFNHRNLVEVIDITVYNAGTGGATVIFHRDRTLYVYNAQRRFVGTTDRELPFSSRFFLASSPIDNFDNSATTTTTTTPTTPTTPPPPPQPTAATSITPAAAQGLAEQAIRAAAPGATPSIRLTNPSNVSLASLQAVTSAASGRNIVINADSLDLATGNVDVRVRLDPALATTDLNLSASAIPSVTSNTRTMFERILSRPVSVVSLGQQSSFGMDVQIAARVDLPAGASLGNLRFYSLDRASNTFQSFVPRNVSIDANGFLHFTTSLAGCIIIS